MEHIKTHRKCYLLPLVAFLGSLCLVAVAAAHPVPDGVIFRGIQAVVWSDRIEIRYQLGLSDNMVQQELQRLLPPAAELPAEAGAAIREYGNLMFPALPQKMSATIDGEARQLVPRRILVVRHPHVQLELTYRVPFAVSATPAHFILADDNFDDVPGYHLAAIKARGEVELLESTAAAVLSRLSRVPETDQELAALTTPVRRVEALLVTANRSSVATPASDQTQTVPGADAQGAPPAAGTASGVVQPPSQGVSPPAAEPSGRQASQRAPAETGRSPALLVWPLLGGLLILIAVVWMVAILRRS